MLTETNGQKKRIDHRVEMRGALQEVARRLEKTEGVLHSSQVIHNRIRRNHFETLRIYADVIRDIAIKDSAMAARIEKLKQDILEVIS